MDVYIEQFEHFATSQGWDQATWAISLSPLLTGKGLEVYTSLSLDVAHDYKALKKLCLNESRPDHGEILSEMDTYV